ncbi:MAG: branched-chain amino acid ABC transporter permease [Nitrososphaerota archaeon]|nr:branched-chain amino acid ABC transporter permease [Nitrososphaerota archaeon]
MSNGSATAKSLLRQLGIFKRGRTLSPVVVLVGLVAAGIYPLTIAGPQYVLSTYSVYFMWIALAVSWNMVGGYAGLLNLGLVAFFGLGAIIAGLAMAAGIQVVPAMIIAGVAGILFSLTLIPTFRLRSDYFAIATLVVPVIIKPLVEYFSNRESLNVPLNLIMSAGDFYYLGLAMAGLSIFGVLLVMRSRVGIALRATGDDETASASLGVNVLFYKTIALMISGFIAAIAGAFYLQLVGSISTTVFSDLSFSLFPIFMVIIGGIGTFEGPILGALIFSLIEYYSPVIFANSNADELAFSVVIIIVAVLLPKGIVSTVTRLYRRRSPGQSISH